MYHSRDLVMPLAWRKNTSTPNLPRESRVNSELPELSWRWRSCELFLIDSGRQSYREEYLELIRCYRIWLSSDVELKFPLLVISSGAERLTSTG